MEQDHSQTTRERAVSSEPCSTRPNPFDDNDLSARKRRRTSLSTTSSKSAILFSLQTEQAHVTNSSQSNVSADTAMALVSSDVPMPSTPPESPGPLLEPVSSRVTINLRNGNLRDEPDGAPPSPSPNATRTGKSPGTSGFLSTPLESVIQEVSSVMTPVAGSPEDPVIIPDDSLEERMATTPSPDPTPEEKEAHLRAALAELPYYSPPGDTCFDTFQRLHQYLCQGTNEPDEVLRSLVAWLEKILMWTSSDTLSVFYTTCQQNQAFWLNLPELFSNIWRKYNACGRNSTMDLVVDLMRSYAKLASFTLAADCRVLKAKIAADSDVFEPFSPNFLHRLAIVAHRDDRRSHPDYEARTRTIFSTFRHRPEQESGLRGITQWAELLAIMLPKSPKRTMEYLAKTSALVEAIARSISQEQSHKGINGTKRIRSYQQDLTFTLQFLEKAWDMMATAADKFASQLPGDSLSTLISWLSETHRTILACETPEIKEILRRSAAANPNVPHSFLADAITLERKFSMLERLVRSQQMQLRVSAVGMMCSDLVALWKRYQEKLTAGLHVETDLAFLQYFASYLIQHGTIEYFLSSSCHPEITVESANIIGFLMVTKTYTPQQTDLLWLTIETSRDPRISDALIRMLLRITQLFEPETIGHIFAKMSSLKIDHFNGGMRDLFHSLLQHAYKIPHETLMVAPRQICLRLIQEASIFDAKSTLANPEVFSWAFNEIKDIIVQACPEPGRQELLLSCQDDIRANSATTHGSLQVLFLLTTTGISLPTLVSDYDFVSLLVDEFECALSNARTVGFSPVYSSRFGPARRKFISSVITRHGGSISTERGRRLWDLLVGPGAICLDDVKTGWDDLNNALQCTGLQNGFLAACVEEYLPALSPKHFCDGALEFVRELVLMEVRNPNTMVFDGQSTKDIHSLEILWKMILQAEPRTIADQAIHTLVSEVYVESAAMKGLPPDRAREVHLCLAKRCLNQLKDAAEALRECHDRRLESPSNDEQYKLQFTRSLRVVRALLDSLKAQSCFSAPDLRSLMLQTPSAIDGDLAELKYQAFDGGDQTEIAPIEIGVHNTGASLLASIREITGFHNYRLYYRGQPLTPTSDDICKSIKDLGIVSGLILVRRQSDALETPSRIRPGAFTLEIEVLHYFSELWEYLSMDEMLASEIYQFLIRLPADESILALFENPTTTHRSIFPIGQPFKSLYAVHALKEHLSLHRLRNDVARSSNGDARHTNQSASDHKQALVSAFNLLVAALCDDELICQNLSEDLTILLRSHLVGSYVQIFKDGVDILPDVPGIPSELAIMLVKILQESVHAKQHPQGETLAEQALQAILVSSEKSTEFWHVFRTIPQVGEVIQQLILDDDRANVRRDISRLIASTNLQLGGAIKKPHIAEFFWSIVFNMLPHASTKPTKCDEVFQLAEKLLTRLVESNSAALDLSTCLERCGALLLAHTSTEDITQPDLRDSLAHGLTTLLSLALKFSRAVGVRPPLGQEFGRKLLHHHLFPSMAPMDESDAIVPRPVVNSNTRSALYDILFDLSRISPPVDLLNSLDRLTPFDEGSDLPYFYELPHAFDRQRAVRAPCGYAGLRNLSNTCYLNSLMTQLFMNKDFRYFIMSLSMLDSPHQPLIRETRQLFAALQDSRRRFVDPQSCIAQISTYEEAPIDIHNQMDVDEFYNLLFDRWEAQITSDTDKKRMRSIFGGQLVQQVKSKECNHISERFEDFSAIQCDIKGKATLEESLQAYVDGEIMQGDNKYKCSSCDEFVDAVKRACFKTLPDNLIFHLKRFDFNLRTMTRAKINDHFRFPARIDMAPYTVNHLAAPSSPSAPDVFELVGVLVHSGSAESGHYYSYIRERTATGLSKKWVEFNDDVVTDWDSSFMEDACYGGHNQRQPFDGGPHEKAYSAYMLFYQRSTSEKPEFFSSDEEGEGSPYRVPLPSDLIPDLRDENRQIVHRHSLHDPGHLPFVIRVLNSVWKSHCSSADHAMENLAMRVGLSHLDQVASRAKDLSDFQDLFGLLYQACQRCPQCSFAFFEYMSRRPEALMMLLQKNPSPTVRHEISRAFISTLCSLKKHFPEPYGMKLFDNDDASEVGNMITQTVDIFLRLWDQFHVSLRSWPELFGTLVEFARLGKLEAAALVQGNFLHQVVAIITVDTAPDLDAQYARLATTLSRRMATRPPNYENIIALIDVLLEAMDEEVEEDRILEAGENRFVLAYEEDSIPFSTVEINLLHQQWTRTHGNIFVDKLVQLDQNGPATHSIIRRLLGFSTIMDDTIFATLKAAITGDFVHYSVSPYLKAAQVYCIYSQSMENILRLRAHVNDQCSHIQSTEARSFFNFQRSILTNAEDSHEHVRALAHFHKWAPGLLGHIDHTVSRDVCHFIQETLLKYGPTPEFNDSEGGVMSSKIVVVAARQLCLACLVYLRDHHVERGVPAARDTISPLLRIISDCEAYFAPEDDEITDPMDTDYHDLCQDVLGPLSTLTVDELEDETSDWEASVGSSEQLNDLDELGM